MFYKSVVKPLVVVCLTVSAVVSAGEKDGKKPMPEPAKKVPAGQEQLAPMDQPLVTVEGKTITSRDYANFLQTNPKIISKAFDSEQGKSLAIREMVSIYLLRKAMYDEGLLAKADENPPPKTLTEAYEKLAENHFPYPPIPDEQSAFAYYQAHGDDYGIPAMLRLSEIHFKFPKGADEPVKAAARARAEKALKQLESGESFEVVAGQTSENPIGKVAAGDIGFVETGKQPWLDEALKNLKPGERTGIVQGESGFYIFKLTDTRKGLVSPYANVRDGVIKAMREEEQKKLRDAYVKTLSKKAAIDITMPSIKKMFPNGMFE